MAHLKWILFFLSLGAMVFVHAWAAFGDTVTLKDGQQIQGKLRLQGILGVEPNSELSSLSLSQVRQARVAADRILFLMDDGSWVECEFLSPDLVIEKEGLWQIVSVDSVKQIQLDPRTGPDAVVALKESEEVPVEPGTTPPPGPGELEGGLPELPPKAGSETLSLEPVPVTPAERKQPAEHEKRAWASLEGGYTLFLGNDRDYLSDGPGYGFSLGYDLFRKRPWFIGPELSFLRSSHGGKESLGDITQNTNTLGFGLRAGYSFERVDCYGKVQLGPVFLDSSSGKAGRNDTFFGFQGGLGANYWILPWLAAGPEVRITEVAGQSSWVSLLARISARF